MCQLSGSKLDRTSALDRSPRRSRENRFHTFASSREFAQTHKYRTTARVTAGYFRVQKILVEFHPPVRVIYSTCLSLVVSRRQAEQRVYRFPRARTVVSIFIAGRYHLSQYGVYVIRRAIITGVLRRCRRYRDAAPPRYIYARSTPLLGGTRGAPLDDGEGWRGWLTGWLEAETRLSEVRADEKSLTCETGQCSVAPLGWRLYCRVIQEKR
ncbi:Uncharacterized protein DBV15_02602 [Temnothorax longispinosus]|uniref:Uncharacterized protein n=1 Tax=Temnothorax longispinosus TaxID=300112 RepID=A0A4V3S9X7_9HYME|nr:Uncharacterized protein DBV15_02602 [Temnothorax longispinosus]